MKSTLSKPSLGLGSFSFRPAFILSAILFLAFALRMARLDFQPLWWDEGYSLFFATRDFATLLDRTALDIHPPLYYAMLQLWIWFAGTSDVAVRFFSVAIGVAGVSLAYVLARRLLNQTTALIAAFLFALAPVQVYYSQEVRMYGLVTVLGIASVYLFIRLLDAPNRLLWLAYVLITAAALYTQYYAAFIIVFQTIYLMVSRQRFTFSVLRSWLFAWLAVVFLYLPWIIYAGNRLYAYATFKVGHEAYPTQDPFTFLAQHLVVFSIGHVSTLQFLNWVTVLFVLLSIIGISALYHHRVTAPSRLPTSPFIVISLYLIVPLALGYIVNLWYPFHPIRYERLLLLASPAFYLLVAMGVSAFNRRVIAFFAVGMLAAFSAFSLFDFYTVARYPDDDYRPLITQMQTLAQPGDNFLAIYPWQIGYLESYYHGESLTVIETPNDAWINSPSQMQNDVSMLLAKKPRVWIPALQTLGRIVEDSLDSNLRPKTYSVLDTWFGTTRLELFATGGDPPQSPRSLSFENGLTLYRWGVTGNPLVSGRDTARIWFDWGANPSPQMKLSLRMLDSKGNVWMQDDRDVEPGIQRLGMQIPAGTPPGVYNLRLALYRNNDASASAVTLAAVTIESNQDQNLAAIPHRTTTTFVNGVQLVGFDATMKTLKPSETTGVTLFWQASQKQNVDYAVTIQLQDALGKNYLDAKDAIALGVYGSSRWRSNELVRDPRTFSLGGNVPDGTYSLNVALIDPTTQAHVKTTDGRDSIHLTTVLVQSRKHYFSAPAPSHKADMRFGDVARLVGYDSVRSGQNLRVVLYWQAVGRSQISYKGFVHILDSNAQLQAQRDQVPGVGEFPTTTWVSGEYLVDIYDITFTSDSASFQIQIGLYDPVTGTRLSVIDASGNQIEDSVVLK